ncbi:MAG: hypothetical protein ACE5EW_07695 [Thermoplasmata archaeon]
MVDLEGVVDVLRLHFRPTRRVQVGHQQEVVPGEDIGGDAHLVRVQPHGRDAAALPVPPVVHLPHGGEEVSTRDGLRGGEAEDPAAPLRLPLFQARRQARDEVLPGGEDALDRIPQRIAPS